MIELSKEENASPPSKKSRIKSKRNTIVEE
jgi:hypothetical protein